MTPRRQAGGNDGAAVRELERALRELERRCDLDYAPLAGRIDALSGLVDQIVTEIGGVDRGSSKGPIRDRLHKLENTEAGHLLVADALKSRDHKLRDRLTLAFAGVAALAAAHPWSWFG